MIALIFGNDVWPSENEERNGEQEGTHRLP